MLRLNLVKDGLDQVLLQDISEISAGASRVILDFVNPVTKRIELNELSEIKPYNFVNPLINAFLGITSSELEQGAIEPDIYEIIYSVHYPYREELIYTKGDNELHGIGMLTLLGDANWMYIGSEYYQVIRQYSTQDYLFLDRPITEQVSVGEMVYRDKVYIPLVEGIRWYISEEFKKLTSAWACTKSLEKLMHVTMMLMGLRENALCGNVAVAKSQLKDIKRLIGWENTVSCCKTQ